MPLADLTCRPPLNWVGGKGAIRDIVQMVFPPWADRHAEHFCGGAGILLIQIAVGALYMFSVPRGYSDGFTHWCKQIIGLCLTAFLQATILVAGLMVFKDKALLGLGLMLSAGEVPRIAGAFGLDTSTRASLTSAVHTAQMAVSTTKIVAAAVSK